MAFIYVPPDWEEIHHEIIPTSRTVHNITNLSIGPEGTYKRWQFYLSVFNGTPFIDFHRLFLNGDMGVGNYWYRFASGVGAAVNPLISHFNNPLYSPRPGDTFRWLLQELASDPNSQQFYISGYHYPQDLRFVNQAQALRWFNLAGDTVITEIRVDSFQVDGIGAGSEFLIVGLRQ